MKVLFENIAKVSVNILFFLQCRKLVSWACGYITDGKSSISSGVSILQGLLQVVRIL